MAELKDQELNKEEMNEVFGGYLFNASVLYEYDAEPWQVLDKYGDVVCRFTRREYACDLDNRMGLSPSFCKGEPMELTWEQVQRLRETGSPD